MDLEELWLIFRCRRRDPDAFAALFDRYHRAVYRTALHLVRDPGQAEDITQEAFVTVFLRVRDLRTPSAFRSWLYRVVVSQAARARRGSVGRSAVPLDLLPEAREPATADLEAEVARREDAAAVRAALRDLDDEHRLVVLLRYFSGLGLAEIAAALGVPSGTVKSRLHTARRRLAQALEQPTARQRQSTLTEVKA